MIKVMQVLSDSNIGGAGIVVKTISENLSDHFKTYLIVPRNAEIIKRIDVHKNIEIIEADGISDVSFSMQGLRALHGLIHKIKPDIIHTHSVLSARMAAKIYGKAYIISTRHCVEPITDNKMKFKLKALANNLLSDKIISVCDSVSENLLKSGVTPKKILQIDNSVKRITPLNEHVIHRKKAELNIDGKLVLGYLGRFEDVKNPLALVSIANELKATQTEFVFLIGGMGRLEDELKSLIKQHQLEPYFVLLGYVKKLDEFYNLIDVLVNTSRSEAMPLTMLEAMSCKKPIIAYDIDELSQIIEHNKSGYLIENFDDRAYAQSIVKLFDKATRQQFGQRGYEIFEQKFSLNIMIEKLEKFYTLASSEKRRRNDN